MKKLLIVLISLICLGTLVYFFFPYKIETVCFGDLCPDNGGTYLFYKKTYSEEECASMGANPIVGIGWSRVYAGCSPDNALAKWVEEKLND